jgi:hypothetical protein
MDDPQTVDGTRTEQEGRGGERADLGPGKGLRARRNWKLMLCGAGIGLVYGLVIRSLVQWNTHKWTPVMSISFLIFVPVAMGFVTIFLVERRQPQPVWIWLLLPWVTVLGGSLGTMLALWEGFICVIMFTPIGLICGSLGGLLAGLVIRIPRSMAAKNACLAVVALFPLLSHPWLHHLLTRRDLRTVENVRVIHASPTIIWKNIARVPRIRPEELPFSWSHHIGFPSPVEATLSFAGVGGVRHATFERGVLFIENVDTWEAARRLAFSIHAQTDQIPPTTLDEHVRVGGPFFDVLRGGYTIEPLPGGGARLHLASQHRISTDFNWYARFWTDAVMSDLQETILFVIQKRCETEAHEGTGGEP